MRSYVDRIRALEGKDGILSVSLIHGFMAGDVPEMGTRVLVVSDDAPEKGEHLARALGEELYRLRGATAMDIVPLESGMEKLAAILETAPDKPVTIADVWDNPGGGCAGDGTHVLRALIDHGFGDIGVATIWDPIAVQFAHAAGLGGRLDLRIGGKASALAGEPLDLHVEITHLSQEGWQSFRGSRVTLGRAATVRVVGTEIDIILISSRTQTYEPDVFSNMGIDFSKKRILLIKSTNHFFAGFDPVSRAIIYVEAPSTYPTDPAKTNYRKMTRPIWPRVADPLELGEP